eukprot:2022668-Amphidinium_carterae.1
MQGMQSIEDLIYGQHSLCSMNLTTHPVKSFGALMQSRSVRGENVGLYEMAFEQQYHYGVFYAWVKLREQDVPCSRMVWLLKVDAALAGNPQYPLDCRDGDGQHEGPDRQHHRPDL